MKTTVRCFSVLTLLIMGICAFSGFSPAGKYKYKGQWEVIEGDSIISFVDFQKGDGFSFISKATWFIPKNTTMRYRIDYDKDPHHLMLNVYRANGDLIGGIFGLMRPIDKQYIEMKLKWDERPKSFEDEEGIYLKLIRL